MGNEMSGQGFIEEKGGIPRGHDGIAMDSPDVSGFIRGEYTIERIVPLSSPSPSQSSGTQLSAAPGQGQSQGPQKVMMYKKNPLKLHRISKPTTMDIPKPKMLIRPRF
eukprot:PhF_6_TR14666/c0_g1_i1/m.23128